VPQGGPEKEGDPPAQLYWVDLTLGRDLLDLACVIQGWRKRKDLVVKAEPPRVALDTGMHGSGLASLIAAVDPPTRERFLELHDQHRSAWTELHTAAVKRRLNAPRLGRA
jgi:hypothetical protein